MFYKHLLLKFHRWGHERVTENAPISEHLTMPKYSNNETNTYKYPCIIIFNI